MEADGPRAPSAARGTVELRLRSVSQLFDAMDPSPFRERDLDRAVEEFIVGWARELPHDTALKVVLHVREWPTDPDAEHRVAEAVAHYFAERARVVRSETHEQLRQGRFNLAVGVSFMLACLFLAEQLGGPEQRGLLANFLYDGLTIVGWVVLWRPLDTFLYDYWQRRRRERLYRRIASAPIELQPSS